jgi:hypothetical protein
MKGRDGGTHSGVEDEGVDDVAIVEEHSQVDRDGVGDDGPVELRSESGRGLVGVRRRGVR